MKRTCIVTLLCLLVIGAYAQGPRVPSEMEFAGMQLKLNDAARRTIQSEVDALHRSRKYLDLKLDRVNMYFPIIERIFQEEGLPDDFKYLVIQESSLVSDAVSTSNAVGYWQFKKESAEEVGLRVSGSVDERMNIVSATRGAARYLKRNNNYFDNWVYALLSYHQGAGGAMKLADKRYYGSSKYTVTKKDHWYIHKFLAHKIAYENELYKSRPSLSLVEYTRGGGKSLKDIAKETNTDENLVEEYNKWLRRGKVPDDKIYAVILPTKDYKPQLYADMGAEKKEVTPKRSAIPQSAYGADDPSGYPKLEGYNANAVASRSIKVVVNGRDGAVAGPGATIASLSTLGDVSERRFLKYNDLSETSRIEQGQVYYFKRKRGKASVYQHVAQPGETWWSISQKYGIREKSLLRKNRERDPVPLKAGRVLWLRYIRPSDEPIQYREIKTEVAQKEEEIRSSETSEVVSGPVSEHSGQPEKANEQEPQNKASVSDEDQTVTAAEINADLAEEPAGRDMPEIAEEEDETTESLEKGVQNSEKTALKQEKSDTEEPSENDVRWVEINETPAEESTTMRQKHTVQAGETLFGLSRKYNVPVEDLKKLNGLPDNNIQPGQELLIKPAAENKQRAPQKEIIHEVQPGETLYGIARKYKVTLQQIMNWNDLEGFDLQMGQRLRILENQ